MSDRPDRIDPEPKIPGLRGRIQRDPVKGYRADRSLLPSLSVVSILRRATRRGSRITRAIMKLSGTRAEPRESDEDRSRFAKIERSRLCPLAATMRISELRQARDNSLNSIRQGVECPVSPL